MNFLGFAKPTSLAVSLRGVCEAGAAGGSTQHWKEPPKGCACISEYYRPGLTIQHWTRLCNQRIEKILTLRPVQMFHKGPHGIRLKTIGWGNSHCHSYFFPKSFGSSEELGFAPRSEFMMSGALSFCTHGAVCVQATRTAML